MVYNHRTYDGRRHNGCACPGCGFKIRRAYQEGNYCSITDNPDSIAPADAVCHSMCARMLKEQDGGHLIPQDNGIEAPGGLRTKQILCEIRGIHYTAY